MNSQNNNENGNNADNAVTESSKEYDDIYSYSSKLPPQTEENIASNGEKGEVAYAKRSINDDINDYKFVKSHHSHHHRHRHHSGSEQDTSDSEDTLLVQSSRPAKGSEHKKAKKKQLR